MKIQVEVQNDYLEKLSHVRRPLLALAELIWNGFDADATEVRVGCSYNSIGGLEELCVQDNGHGILYEDVIPSFKNLGGSWKAGKSKSKNEGRILHGKAGKGRFKAFSLGSNVEWITCYSDNNSFYEYKISGKRTTLGTFEVETKVLSKKTNPGTLVRIFCFDKNYLSLLPEKAIQEIDMMFALYMRQYPHISLIYDGQKVNPANAELYSEEYKISPIKIQDGRMVDVNLIVIEWKPPAERYLFLCDKHGFSLEKTTPGVQAPGFNFTGYLKSDFLKELDENNTLILDELQPDLKLVLDAGRNKLKEHFRKRVAQQAVNRVEQWKKEEVYPYKEEPKNILETTERQVFDVCALSLSDYLPDFEESNIKNKRIALYFLKQAIESSPESVQSILQDVLDLPKEKQQELSDLLKKTSLSAIINASKEVADRLDFLKGLELLVFDKEIKKGVLERSQLHRILANHTWIFGEEFNLSNDDESLTSVLEKYLKLLGREEKIIQPVLREDGSEAIIDLMLSRSIPQPLAEEREHLVIELKRPIQKADSNVATQIENYALAVANDERFRDTKTKWIFWAVANEMNDNVRKKVNQKGRAEGLLYEDSEQKITVWIKTWAQIIESCRGRLKFYQERLEYCASTDSGLSYLRATHNKYLPRVLQSVNKE